ncbi:MFS transporter [Tamilnaduibacter salinus]|uniref:MFS transporter n=1 Tax=Tamilnaduibacter salinus TaxID=1484056 RepID=A0A2A2I187_9GAMM|nr:MFS transporter [Tamilnaduibacter salinus]PAV25056.1 MFS transporter [Tamilnaduibacter salinus]
MTSKASPSTPTARSGLALLALLWLAGLYLRVPVLVAPALAPFVAEDLGLSQALTGALTTLPVFMLAVGAMPGSLAISRIGPRATLAIALVVTALGSALRGLAPEAMTLMAASTLMGLGIAAMQPALPALLRVWLTPDRLALGTAVYMNGMLMGEFIGAGVTLPVMMPLMDDSWRWTLIGWSVPAFLVAAALFLPRERVSGGTAEADPWLPDWKNPLTWRLGVLLGASGGLFFGTNAYMGNVLEQRGSLDALDSALFWLNLAQVASSLIMLKMARQWVGRPRVIFLMLMIAIVTLALFLLTEGLVSIVFVFMMSFTAGIMLILLVALPPQVARAGETGRLAAGNFTIGYTLSFGVPMLGGLVADLTGQANHAVLAMLIYGLLVMPIAWTLQLPTRNH